MAWGREARRRAEARVGERSGRGDLAGLAEQEHEALPRRCSATAAPEAREG